MSGTGERRRPRRAVRAPGTVGTDDSVLRSVHPAAPPAEPSGERTADPPTQSPTPPGAREDDAWRSLRSADDSDLGWGDRGGDENDERLRRDKPPHW